MKLFTKHIETKLILTALKYQLKIEKIKVVTFENIPSMVFINFLFNQTPFTLVHHFSVENYSFTGSSLNLQIDSTSGVSYTQENHEKVFEQIMKCLSSTFGGFLDTIGHEEFLTPIKQGTNPKEINLDGDFNVQGVDNPGQQNSLFLVQELHCYGVDDQVITDELEKILKKFEVSKTSNC